ncbi:hypothetical protein JCM30760_20410 [Thiomicrorhabdus hydrogeniphila]
MNTLFEWLSSLKEHVQNILHDGFVVTSLQYVLETINKLVSYTTEVAGWLWLIFILIGVSLLFSAFYFRRQSKRLNHALTSLYHMNDVFKQDALEFFDQAWPVLKQVGCENLQAKIDWFGEVKEVQKGNIKSKAKTKSYLVQREDMRFKIIIAYSRDALGKQSMGSLVVQTFLHILEQNLVLKQSEILTSQKRLERYQLFVQHEIKNIAQFIQMLAEQVAIIEMPEAKIKLVDRLSTSLPSMAQRARKTIDHMQQPLDEFYHGDQLEIESLLQNITQIYGLKANIQGEAIVTLPKEALVEVFKNVLGNYRDHSSGMGIIQILIFHDFLGGQVRINILSKKRPGQELKPERMFEPFWTTSESGMGLGLFLARELLKQVDGSIEFYQHEAKLLFGFQIMLPDHVKKSAE